MVNTKTAVVFGSTGGIGKCVVAHFRKQHYNLGLFSRSQAKCWDGCTLACPGDASDYREVEQFLLDVEERFGNVDIVVFAVGSTEICMRKSYEDNVISLHNVLLLTGLLFPQSKVFVIGSLRSQVPNVQKETYCVNKAAVEMLVQTKRLQFPDLSITLIRPGFVDTPVYGKDSKLPYYPDGTPYPTIKPDDIATLILNLIPLEAKVKVIEMGELLGDRKDLVWKLRT